MYIEHTNSLGFKKLKKNMTILQPTVDTDSEQEEQIKGTDFFFFWSM